jgi:hypothetical protein
VDTLIKTLGVVFVLVAALFALLRQVRKKPADPPHKGDIGAAMVVGVLGCLLIISPRITSVPTPFGAVHAAVQQALVDASDIAALKTQAQTQTATINLVADEATKAKALSETVAEHVAEAQAKLTALNTALMEANSNLIRAKQEEEFTMTVLSAQAGDDRTSFDNLRKIAADKTNQFRDLAHAAWVSVLQAHTSSFYGTGFAVIAHPRRAITPIA